MKHKGHLSFQCINDYWGMHSNKKIILIHLLVSQKVNLHRNLLEGFVITLKVFPGLALPNQYCEVVRKDIFGWF